MRADHGPGGFLVIDKPAGMTSFDVIRQLRRLLGIQKLGHSGVLDRPAMGVLVIGAGQATRLFELFGEFDKEYEADIWLGLSTTTDDLMGEAVPRSADPRLACDGEVAEALASLTGAVQQTPPAFSLAKVAGRESYRYALAGQPIDLAPREVHIERISLLSDTAAALAAADLPPDSKLDWAALGGRQLRRLAVRVLCQGGVYIRSIARDLGERLGCGGAVGRLVRRQVGPFRLDDAVTLEDIAARLAAGATGASFLRPLEDILPAVRSVVLTAEQLRLVLSGRAARMALVQLPPGLAPGDRACAVALQADAPRLAALIVIGEPNAAGVVELQPSKVLLAEAPAFSALKAGNARP